MSAEGYRQTISQVEKDAIDQRREYHFQNIVKGKILESMKDSLDEVEFSPEQVDEIGYIVAGLPEDQLKVILAVPYEIRNRLFTRYREEVEGGRMTPQQIVDDLLAKNTKYGFSIGYHISPKMIPKERKPDGSEVWNIKGTEIDDRDNSPDTTNSNLRMAYYSEDYLSRYKKKPGNYLYAVRAEIGPNATHKRDLNNRWGRAPSLSIISELDMQDVEKEINEAIEQENAAARSSGA